MIAFIHWRFAPVLVLVFAIPNQFSLAQSQTVQLPTIIVFNVQTTVIIPDGGTMLLGSVGRSAMGETSRGVPLLSNVPGAGRLFRNRVTGQETSARNATATAQIISLREMEPEILAEGNRRLAESNHRPDPETQRRAEFMSRNIGQSVKPR